jgi:transcriptional regulator with XRE-family HTH domain
MNPILKTWREKAEFSVTEAAQAAGVTPAMWSRWENNKRDVPVERAIALEEVIGISKHDLRPDIFGPKPEAAA